MRFTILEECLAVMQEPTERQDKEKEKHKEKEAPPSDI
jgi:hypothetical protein